MERYSSNYVISPQPHRMLPALKFSSFLKKDCDYFSSINASRSSMTCSSKKAPEAAFQIQIITPDCKIIPLKIHNRTRISYLIKIFSNMKIDFDVICSSSPSSLHPATIWDQSMQKDGFILEPNCHSQLIVYALKRSSFLRHLYIDMISPQCLEPFPLQYMKADGHIVCLSLSAPYEIPQIQSSELPSQFSENALSAIIYRPYSILEPSFQLKRPKKAIDYQQALITIFESKSFHVTSAFDSFVDISSKALSERRSVIEKEPLRAFVALTDSKPEFSESSIIIAVSFGLSKDIDLPKVMSFQVKGQQSANEAMTILFDRVSAQGQSVGGPPTDFCFSVPGTDEIIAGPWPLCSFIIVQSFLESSESMLNLTVCELSSMIPRLSDQQGLIEAQLRRVREQRIKDVENSGIFDESEASSAQTPISDPNPVMENSEPNIQNLQYSDENRTSTQTLDIEHQSLQNNEESAQINQSNSSIGSIRSSASSTSIRSSTSETDLQSLSSLDIKEPKLVPSVNEASASMTATSISSFIPHYLLRVPLQIIIEGVRLLHKSGGKIRINSYIMVGSRLISPAVSSKAVHLASFTLFGTILRFDMTISNLPLYSRICFAIIHEYKSSKTTKACGSYPLFDRNQRLQTGRVKLGLFEGNLLPPTPSSSPSSKYKLSFRMPEFPIPVFYGSLPVEQPDTSPLSLAEEAKVAEIAAISPLTPLTTAQAEFVVQNRWRLLSHGEVLCPFLRSIDFSSFHAVNELRSILPKWTPPKGYSILSILGGEFLDPSIRNFVIQQLNEWSNQQISMFLLQIVQSLQFDTEDDSPLSLFLMRRAFLEPKYLGLQLFWQLRSSADIPWIHTRMVNMTLGLVVNSEPSYGNKYIASFGFTAQQLNLCRQFSSKTSKDLQKAVLSLSLPSIQLPIDPKKVVTSYVSDGCRVIDSKKRPLMLAFKGADPFCRSSIITMIKLDDDLRQDQLTLQIMRVMDFIWKQNGLNLRMSLYSVLPTGKNQGYIEIVQNSSTIANLQKEYSGKISGALSKEFIFAWMNEIHSGMPAMAVENFKYSLAGYCVATYVLGIGDRHTSNIMVREDGRFFHIDFGHFLGHFKKKLGIERETGLFYYSPAFTRVLGGKESETYKDFLNLCVKAFNTIRENYPIFEHLLMLMVGTGIPELSGSKDIRYFEKSLRLDLNNEEAGKFFIGLIDEVEGSAKIVFNDFCHLQAH